MKKPKYMCNCMQAQQVAGVLKVSQSHAMMVETVSSDGIVCDYCRYVAYQDRGYKAHEPQRKDRRIKVAISDWHRQDERTARSG